MLLWEVGCLWPPLHRQVITSDILKYTYHREPSSRDAGEVMVFIVIANIEGEQIEAAVVGVGFMALEEHVVFGDKVPGDRVYTHT